MYDHSADLVRLYLPLLNHAQEDVRRQAYTVLMCAAGRGALVALRHLVQGADPEARRQAQQAISVIASFEGADVKVQSSPGLYVTCLGSLRLSIAGRWIEMRDWSPAEGGRAGWQKVHAVFGFLVHSGRHGTTRRALGEAVWGAAASGSSLARTLSTLRQALVRAGGEEAVDRALVLNDDYCRLDPASYSSDVAVFERVYSLASDVELSEGLAAAVPLYAQALDLYTGPYMADVLPGSGWMRPQRELLASYAIIAAERLAEAAYERGDFRRCVLICLQALGADPTADDIVIWMLRAYARLGHYGELEFAYRSYLQAAGIAPGEAATHQDAVLQTYEELVRARSVNE